MSYALLALETAAPTCSVALHDGNTLRQRSISGPGVHSEHLFVFVQGLLAEACLSITALSAVLISAGPGSYTGLRIASSAAKGLLFGTDIPLIAVQTLAGIAAAGHGQENHKPHARIHAVLNARRTHLYHQAFAAGPDGRLKAQSEPALRTLSDIRNDLRAGDILAGTGYERLQLEDTPALHNGLVLVSQKQALSAASLISLHQQYGTQFAQMVPVEAFEPMYQPA